MFFFSLLFAVSLIAQTDRGKEYLRPTLDAPEAELSLSIRLPWRRRDNDPKGKRIIITDASTGKEIDNVFCPQINREYGDIVFRPQKFSGEYYIYYMPYKLTNHNYNPITDYLKPENKADEIWKASLLQQNMKKLKEARLIEFQARDSFYIVSPMELIATEEETADLVNASSNKDYMLFPEYREYPIAMKNDLPLRWIKNGASNEFTGQAQPGEYYTFQIGYYALTDVEDIEVAFEGDNIDRNIFTCFNTSGIDWKGEKFEKQVSVKANQVQPLWCGLQIPDNFRDEFSAKVKIKPSGLEESDVEIRKVMDRSCPGCLFDFHCGNYFHPEYRMNNISNFFMEHFPFISSLWLGEGFDYNESPDYWLIEVAGIPYGLYGEMLGKGNPWRGMVFGMTERLMWRGGDPRAIWELWDDFGIDKSQMLGYWSKRCPVKTGDDKIKATAYVREGKTLIVIGSWTGDKAIELFIDWKAIGIDKSKAIITAPKIEGLQDEKLFSLDEPISVKENKGWLLIVSK